MPKRTKPPETVRGTPLPADLHPELAELRDRLKNSYGVRAVSMEGLRVAALTDRWLGGLHHFGVTGLRVQDVDWGDRSVSYPYGGNLSTYDGSDLSCLVMLSFAHCIRVEVTPRRSLHTIKVDVMFHPRDSRHGSMSERLPTLESFLAENAGHLKAPPWAPPPRPTLRWPVLP